MIDEDELLLEKLGDIWFDFDKRLRDCFKDLTDEKLAEIPQLLESLHEDSRGFRSTIWDEISDTAADALRHRAIFKVADEYLAKNPEVKIYCLFCQGECKGDDYHEYNYKASSKEEKRLKEMSRDDLIAELLKKENA